MRFPGRLWLAVSLFLAVSGSAQVTTVPKQGIRENDPRVHALTNARIVSAPGKTIEKGTVLIRDGLIVDALEEPEEADPIAVELVMRTILDRGDAADRLSVAEREEELSVGLAVKRICFGVERVTDGDAQWRHPLRVVGGVIDLPREIDEATQIP